MGKKFNWMVSEKIRKKTNLGGIFGNSQMNYFTEFDLNIDIVLVMYIFCSKIIFHFFFV